MNAGRMIALLLPLFLAAKATDAAAAELPITFTQSAKSVSVRLANDGEKSNPEVALEAFGRRWTAGVIAHDNTAEFDVPTVRVPTLFRIATVQPPHAVLGELVAYPPGYKLKWKQKSSRDQVDQKSKSSLFISAEAPAWFVEWAAAVGLPLQPVDAVQSRDIYLAEEQRRRLLIVGRAGAGRSPRDVMRLMEKHAPAALVLEADWFGKQKPWHGASSAPPIVILPNMLAGPLSKFKDQHWAAPPLFTSVAEPWPRIVNRRAWIQRERLLLLENISSPEGELILSYVPWQRMLGRNEWADVLFREILLAAARPRAAKSKWSRRISMVWPSEDEVRRQTRPVLRVAINNRPASSPWSSTVENSPLVGEVQRGNASRLRVVDLRGPNLSASDAANLRVPKKVSLAEPLLVLGIDPAVDDGRWAGPPPLEKYKKKHPEKWPPGLIWLADDVLPPSASSQTQLMQELTRWRIPLNPIGEEGKDQ